MNTQEKLFTGKDIRKSNTDVLQPASLGQIFTAIKEPDDELNELLHQLMQVRILDEGAYNKLKLRLPYFIGATFRHGLRSTANFEEINHFVIDIDNCFTEGTNDSRLLEVLKKDNRIALMFISPGGKGLKLLFTLATPMTDSALYTNFYKAFSTELARTYKLEQYLDFKTSDVTRVCFLSADPKAWYNPAAKPVDWHHYISQYDLFNTVEREENDGQDNEPPWNNDGDNDSLPDDVYAEILQRLNPKTPKRQKIIYVPDVLNDITAPVSEMMEKAGFGVHEIRDIHYGKKFIVTHGNDFADINVFYGRSGFTVVISPKKGHHPRLAEVVKTLIEKVLYDRPDDDNGPRGSIDLLAEALKNLNPN